jgi:hypothetical protein
MSPVGINLFSLAEVKGPDTALIDAMAREVALQCQGQSKQFRNLIVQERVSVIQSYRTMQSYHTTQS